MKYKSIVVTRRGGPETLQIVENEQRPPPAFSPSTCLTSRIQPAAQPS